VKQVYKITYPTGKVYIGKDSYGSCRYMGSPDPQVVNDDFCKLSDDERRDYTIRKQVLWESDTASEAELSAKEVELIRAHRANDPRVGYNRWPKFGANELCPPEDQGRSPGGGKALPASPAIGGLPLPAADPPR
jgi:hypothetical protein